ncbi:MAG: Hydrogenase-4 component B [Burkholderiaceae bacterium]|nr:MAG: Hydrogenase-4 component B [Burkholderiaceae bacterium]
MVVWAFLTLVFALLVQAVPVRRVQRAGFLAGGWAAALLILTGATQTLIDGASVNFTPATLAILPGFGFTVDPLRAFFLAIAAAVYGLSVAFVASDADGLPAARARLVFGFTTVLFAAMLAVLLAAGVTSLMFAWEVMSLALAALVFLGSHAPRATHAGMVTLAFSEMGALAALAGLLILAASAGTLSLSGIAAAAPQLPRGAMWAGFLLTFFGFGVKTGILPVNVWMGEGYMAAPRGVLPIFSGATLNLGVFTLWVIDGPLASHAPNMALVVLVTGALTAIIGIMYAFASHSLTRLLTQSSIENLGIVVAAIGAGFAFAAMGRPTLAGLALVAGLYHMLNHSAYKTLLFLGSGAIGAAAGDDLDRLGGLMRRATVFGTLFLLGAFAIAALPPFNGFVSEWLVLESFLRVVELGPIPVRIVFALSGALLALTAGLAVTCFAMLAASALLGLPRSREAAAVTRMPASATAPMAVLAVVCFALAMLATGVIPILGRFTADLAGVNPTGALVPEFFGHVQQLSQDVTQALSQLGAELGRGIVPLRGLVVLHAGPGGNPIMYAMSTVLSFAVIALLLLLVWLFARGLRRHRRVVRRVPWDAGLARIRPEMTYTATAFAAPVRVLFHAVFDPEVAREEERQGAFLTAMSHREVRVHLVDRLLVNPLAAALQANARLVARMHHGKVTIYATYVLVSLVVVMLAAAATLS